MFFRDGPSRGVNASDIRSRGANQARHRTPSLAVARHLRRNIRIGVNELYSSFYSIHGMSSSTTQMLDINWTYIVGGTRDRLRTQVFFSVDPLIGTTVMAVGLLFCADLCRQPPRGQDTSNASLPSYAYHVSTSSAHTHRLVFPTRNSQYSTRRTLMTLAWEKVLRWGKAFIPLLATPRY